MPPEPVRILVVDDIVENLDALEALLGGDEVQLLRAQSGVDALELLLMHDVALALLDVQMPGMDGFELAELMRGTERTRGIPIIFLTAVATDETRRFRGYEAGAVDYLFKPIDTLVLKSKVDVFVELHRNRRELARQRDELAGALARVRAHRDNSPLAIVEIGANMRIAEWSMGAERMFGRTDQQMIGTVPIAAGWVDDGGSATLAALMREMQSGSKQREILELSLRAEDGSAIEAQCYCSALRDAFGRLVSINLQIQDVTERKRAEATQHLLIGELNHRVKNTLASVQAIASQTLRHSSGPSEFAPTFIGRIHSLSAAHSLLSDATWRGASLRELIQGQFEIGVAGAERLSAFGPDLELSPEPALHLALVFHELVTNAAKYGALSNAEGRVDLNWSVVDDMVRFEWVESGGPTVRKPSRKGFGTQLIQRSVAGDGGSAEVIYDRSGAHWLINLPVSRIGRKNAARRKLVSRGAEPDQADETRFDHIAGKSVLLIEDEPLVALNITDLVEQAGAKVIMQASTCEGALEALEKCSPDLVILDGNLHGQGVEEIARRLSARGTPFIMVSGYGREHLPPELSEAPVIVKPFGNAELLNALGKLMMTADRQG